MKYAVFGAGGVGGYFGGRLAESGQDVVFIARGAHLDALRSNGLVVSSVSGDFTVSPAQCASSAAEAGPVDVVLLGVKAWQLREVAEAIQPLIGPDTAVLPLANGVEAADILSATLGR